MSGSGDAMNDNAIRNELAALRDQVEQLQTPQHRVASFLDQFSKLREMRQRNAENQALVQRAATPKLPTHVRRYLRGQNGFELALRGFDFADKDELQRVKWEYGKFLEACGLNPRSADQVNHSWELAAHNYSSPDGESAAVWQRTGKGFMLRTAWRASLDLRPGSQGLRLWDNYLELRQVRRYRKRYQRRPTFNPDYRKYFAMEDGR